MIWRKEIIDQKLTRKDMYIIKFRICMLKTQTLAKFKFREPTGFLTKYFDRLGPKVNKMFPLVNPNLSFDEAVV